MFLLDQLIHDLSEDDLKKAYDELVELGNTGVLVDGIIRECHRKTVKEVPTFQFSIMVLERAFLLEIAKRHYQS